MTLFHPPQTYLLFQSCSPSYKHPNSFHLLFWVLSVLFVLLILARIVPWFLLREAALNFQYRWAQCLELEVQT